jgi:phosphatidylserine decarboxylase
VRFQFYSALKWTLPSRSLSCPDIPHVLMSCHLFGNSAMPRTPNPSDSPPSRPLPLRAISSRLTRLPFPNTRQRLLSSSPKLGSGRAAALSPSSDSPTLGVLRARVFAARDLIAADRNGKSDPFVVVRLGDSKVESDVVKACLNPAWGDLPEVAVAGWKSDGESKKEVVVEKTIRSDEVAHQTVEIVFWDKDKFKKDYLGEVSLGVQQWFGKGWDGKDEGPVPVDFADPNNEVRCA